MSVDQLQLLFMRKPKPDLPMMKQLEAQIEKGRQNLQQVTKEVVAKAREAAKVVVARYPGKIKQLTAVVTGDYSEVQGQRMSSNADATSSFRIERFNAFSAHKMTYEDYAAVREAWRAFRAGKPVSDPALEAAFQARRAALEDAALGSVEALDDAIK
jgi:hypothetical protein